MNARNLRIKPIRHGGRKRWTRTQQAEHNIHQISNYVNYKGTLDIVGARSVCAGFMLTSGPMEGFGQILIALRDSFGLCLQNLESDLKIRVCRPLRRRALVLMGRARKVKRPVGFRDVQRSVAREIDKSGLKSCNLYAGSIPSLPSVRSFVGCRCRTYQSEILPTLQRVVAGFRDLLKSRSIVFELLDMLLTPLAEGLLSFAVLFCTLDFRVLTVFPGKIS
jgi:hypothetical protein